MGWRGRGRVGWCGRGKVIGEERAGWPLLVGESGPERCAAGRDRPTDRRSVAGDSGVRTASSLPTL
ncbi:hypothetical protein M427DRAFT_473149 [Gonapodya prolifera JEL478]|uniref:Uncharacterized protein n=1 Tax=Gonapodya prolifera (strain JEL478) TaxID=1344416 RepID=A0A139ARB5_GONPJ|nr:hypothetical protein M427DRAFT_473149 [Gonapodya prolifera JEL478]|eukprot:KXS19278.1 hypothetical protein M427DRAFT_473149 [Gonapodya prolifera JEL478]